jgi:uncharacterized protein
MNKLDKLKKDHLQARKDKNGLKTNTLGTLLGEVQTKLKNATIADADEVVESTAKKMYNAIKDTMDNLFIPELVADAKEELNYIELYLPQTLSKEEIKEILDEINILNLPSFGAKMGAAMNTLKGKADGKDVKEVVTKHFK